MTTKPGQDAEGGSGDHPYNCSNGRHTLFAIVYVTNFCNFKCEYCFAKKSQGESGFYISLEEFKQRIAKLMEDDPEVNSLNFTGGEPTLHPDLLLLIDHALEKGFGHIVINTNGSILSENEQLLEALSQRGVTLALSINHMPLTKLQEKLFKKLEKYRMPVAIIPISSKDSPQTFPKLFDFFKNHELTHYMEIQPIVYTAGNLLKSEDYEKGRKNKFSMDEMIELFGKITNGDVRGDDFISVGAGHPDCYKVSYLLKIDDGRLMPLTRFADRSKFINLFNATLFPKADAELESFINESINVLWGQEETELNRKMLKAIRRFMKELFPGHPLSLVERNQIIARYLKIIGIHEYMDCFTMNAKRYHGCGRHILLSDGRKVSACYFNNVLKPSKGFALD